MTLIDQIAETRIQEAIADGELDSLPGMGRPVSLEDDSMIPEEFRMAYRVLKNAGVVPPALELRKQISLLEQEVATSQDQEGKVQALKKLQCLYLKLDNSGHRKINLALQEEYYRKVMKRLS